MHDHVGFALKGIRFLLNGAVKAIALVHAPEYRWCNLALVEIALLHRAPIRGVGGSTVVVGSFFSQPSPVPMVQRALGKFTADKLDPVVRSGQFLEITLVKDASFKFPFGTVALLPKHSAGLCERAVFKDGVGSMD
jgi:hypothetical protein